MGRSGFQIGRVSERTGLTVDAIRFYEKQRLLQPAPRSEGGFRLFSTEDIRQIQFIRRAKKLGFSLPEIRELLTFERQQGEVCSHVRDMLQSKLATVRGKIRELRALEAQLGANLRKCERQLKAAGDAQSCGCPVLEEIAKPEAHDA